mgnify:CR=1 FL=1|jgi:hypothetical protein
MSLPTENLSISLNNELGYKTNIEIKNGKLILNSLYDNGEVTIYSEEGSIEFPSIDLGQFYLNTSSLNIDVSIPNDSVFDLYVASSNNNIDFSDYELVNLNSIDLNLINKRFLKFKVNFKGKLKDINITRNKFSESEKSEFILDERIIFNNKISLKTSYNEEMEEIITLNEGKIFKKTIKDYKKLYNIDIEV